MDTFRSGMDNVESWIFFFLSFFLFHVFFFGEMIPNSVYDSCMGWDMGLRTMGHGLDHDGDTD